MKSKNQQLINLSLTPTILYLGVISIVIGLVRWLKELSIWFADKYLYSIPSIGDILRSVEIIDLANIVLFAILGMAFGLASILLPSQMRLKISAILLIPIVAIIFNTTSVIRYRQWVEEVGVQEKLSTAEATGLTNAFLTSQVGKKGFWGFYLYTAKYPMLPQNKIEMREMKRIDDKLKLGLIKIVGEKLSWLVKLMFALAGWIIKLFYLTISLIATISHFKYGKMVSEILQVQVEKMMEKLKLREQFRKNRKFLS
ncbi:MAG: hypothetical protein GDA56_15780 [Hormoscilla sp. GM7CHS1pb]|nr:hypothetical protein [Hormoscilla sp. GM7CHS1pb]